MPRSVSVRCNAGAGAPRVALGGVTQRGIVHVSAALCGGAGCRSAPRLLWRRCRLVCASLAYLQAVYDVTLPKSRNLGPPSGTFCVTGSTELCPPVWAAGFTPPVPKPLFPMYINRDHGNVPPTGSPQAFISALLLFIISGILSLTQSEGWHQTGMESIVPSCTEHYVCIQ